MSRILLVLCAAALLVVPSPSRADDGDQTVRLVIECSPKTADAIQHLLKGLPAKVYRAEPVGSEGTTAAPRHPVGVVSVLPVWNAIEQSLKQEGLPAMTIEKLNITARAARLAVSAATPQDITALRKVLQANPELKRRARSEYVVEPGAIRRHGEHVRGELTIHFREHPSETGARVSKPGFESVKHAQGHAKLRLFRSGAERRDYNRKGGFTNVHVELVFEETHLDNLRNYIALVHEAKGAAPTEIRWALRDKKQRQDMPLIQKPSVKIAQWIAN